MKKIIMSIMALAMIGIRTTDINSYYNTEYINVSGGSMSPRFEDGESVFIFKDDNTEYNVKLTVAVSNSGVKSVKRIVAVEGDTISIKDESISINGKKVCDKCYSSYNVRPIDDTYVIPKGNVFLIGDNLDDSVDSRKYGYISTEYVYGVVEKVFNISVCDYDNWQY